MMRRRREFFNDLDFGLELCVIISRTVCVSLTCIFVEKILKKIMAKLIAFVSRQRMWSKYVRIRPAMV